MNVENYLKSYKVIKNINHFGFGVKIHARRDGNTNLLIPKLVIESKSPAELTGMKNDQCLVAVNNKYLNKDLKDVKQLVEEIDECYYQDGKIEFLVLDNENWEEIQGNRNFVKNLFEPKINKKDAIIPRLCNVLRKTTVDFYGFDFKTSQFDGSHVIINIHKNSPAHLTGLKEFDHILEVNAESVEGKNHEEVVKLITTNPYNVEFLVVEDYDGYQKAKAIKKLLAKEASLFKEEVKPQKENSKQELKKVAIEEVNKVETRIEEIVIPEPKEQIKIVYTQPEEITPLSTETNPTPNEPSIEVDSQSEFKQCIIVLTKNHPSFGFSVSKGTKPKHHITQVVIGSPADKAGLEKNDVIIEISKKNVRKASTGNVMKMIANAKKQQILNLTVISINGYLWYKDQKKTFSKIKIQRDRMKSLTNVDNGEIKSEMPDRAFSKSLSNLHFESIFNAEKPRASVSNTDISSKNSKSKNQVTGSTKNLHLIVDQIKRSEQKKSRESLNLVPGSSSTPISFYENSPKNTKDNEIEQKWKTFFEYSKPQSATLRSDSFQFQPGAHDAINQIVNRLTKIEAGPRTCDLSFIGSELEFYVAASNTPGIFEINNLSLNSPAYNTGLRNGDFILEVNGVSVENKKIDELIVLIQCHKRGNDFQLLVIDRDGLEMMDKASNAQNLTHIKKLIQFSRERSTNSLRIFHKLRGNGFKDIETRL